MKYSSYYLYRKYEKRDGQDVLPVIPAVYSIDGEGTMPKVLHLANDPDCGDIPWLYRWVNLDINTDYWCEECNPDYSKMYFATVALEDNTVIQFNSANELINMELSLDDGISWLKINIGTGINTGATINAGEKILWRGYKESSSMGVGSFGATGKFYVEGNVMSLIFGDDYIGQTDLSGYVGAFSLLFYKNNNLVSAENLVLPATTLSSGCYSDMFQYCTSLTIAPSLPATTLASGCYAGMFERCTSLVTAPALSATTLASDCYSGMFEGCTSLTTAPELPATTLASDCYYRMFSGCTSLTTSPVLSATTLVSSCYREMFKGCTDLSSITCLATSLGVWTSTDDWVVGVSPSGTFKKASNMSSWTTGDSGIPNGWFVLNI